jgi:hypothetical protein
MQVLWIKRTRLREAMPPDSTGMRAATPEQQKALKLSGY